MGKMKSFRSCVGVDAHIDPYEHPGKTDERKKSGGNAA